MTKDRYLCYDCWVATATPVHLVVNIAHNYGPPVECDRCKRYTPPLRMIGARATNPVWDMVHPAYSPAHTCFAESTTQECCGSTNRNQCARLQR